MDDIDDFGFIWINMNEWMTTSSLLALLSAMPDFRPVLVSKHSRIRFSIPSSFVTMLVFLHGVKINVLKSHIVFGQPTPRTDLCFVLPKERDIKVYIIRLGP